MNQNPQMLSRDDMEGRLLDYLYGELEGDARAEFERALPAFPEVAAELERHQWTRSQMARLPVVPLPAGALDKAMAAAEAAALAATPRPSFWERLRRFAVQPAFAMALVAIFGVGIGIYTSKSGRLPSEPAQPTDQEGAGRVAMAHEAADRPDHAPPTAVAPAPAPLAAQGSVGSAAAPADAPAEAAQAPSPQEPVPPSPTPMKAIAPGAPTASPPKLARSENGDEGMRRELAKDSEAELGAATGGAVAKTELDAKKAEAKEDQANDGVSVVGRSAQTSSAGGEERDDAYRGTKAGLAAPPTDTTPEIMVAESPSRNEESRTPVVLAPPQADPAVRDTSKNKTPAVSIDDEQQSAKPAPKTNAPRTESKPNEKAPDRVADDNAARNANPTKPAATSPAPDNNVPSNLTTPKPTPDGLWTTYGQQLAAGAWLDAQKTLGELVKLTGETDKLKAARSSLAKKIDEARRVDAERAKADKPMPEPTTAPAPGKGN